MNLQGKKVAILGLGVEGVSVVRFLQTEGASSCSIFSEKEPLEEFTSAVRNVSVTVGSFPDLSSFDLIVRSPSVRPDIGVLEEARKKGSISTTATNLFMDHCPCPVIGVTGTKGKGTTSSLIYEMVKQDGIDAYLGGNIGTPPLDFLSQLTPTSIVVLELSSFQLWDLEKSPHIGVLVMTTIEHQDVHESEAEYLYAKEQLFLHQREGDFAVINWDYPNAAKIAQAVRVPLYKTSIQHEYSPGCFIKDGNIVFSQNNTEEVIVSTSEIFIPGMHNVQNACSAVAAAKLAGVSNTAIIQTLRTFKGLIHRLEFVEEIHGVRYFDDSFSTTPETAIAAIHAFTEPKILILGGSSKNSDFTELGKVISESSSIRAIIGIGVEWERIKLKIKNEKLKIIEGCKNMEEIVAAAARIAEPGDVVILSPACASFDMFKNYKERGNQFKKEVKKLDVSSRLSEVSIKR
jgi:UDP-N-acetylmuramoylalanine--D-glutamate ligase